MKIIKDRNKLVKEIDENFNKLLADSGINGLSVNARRELNNLIVNHIDYLYFPSCSQTFFELIFCCIPLMVRTCLSDCNFRITFGEKDSQELRNLSQDQVKKLSNYVNDILENYRDRKAEAEVRERSEKLSREHDAKRAAEATPPGGLTWSAPMAAAPSWQSDPLAEFKETSSKISDLLKKKR